MLSVREIQHSDIESIVNYWATATPEHLVKMGVDMKKLPVSEQITQMLTAQVNTPVEQRMSYCIIWELNGKPIGHCNTNPAYFGDHAYMHLHMWNSTNRQKGMGVELVKMTLPYFFEKQKLKKLYCQPYALNPAPNKTLEKAGFVFVKEYITVPGALNFEQELMQAILFPAYQLP